MTATFPMSQQVPLADQGTTYSFGICSDLPPAIIDGQRADVISPFTDRADYSACQSTPMLPLDPLEALFSRQEGDLTTHFIPWPFAIPADNGDYTSSRDNGPTLDVLDAHGFVTACVRKPLPAVSLPAPCETPEPGTRASRAASGTCKGKSKIPEVEIPAVIPKKQRAHSANAPARKAMHKRAKVGKVNIGEIREQEKKRVLLDRNCVAANKSRQKKKEWTQKLGCLARAGQERQDLLIVAISSLREEAMVLKQEMLKHSYCDCTWIQDYLTQSTMNPINITQLSKLYALRSELGIPIKIDSQEPS